MTPDQALELLDKAVALLRVSRQEHATLLEAIKVLKDCIAPK